MREIEPLVVLVEEEALVALAILDILITSCSVDQIVNRVIGQGTKKIVTSLSVAKPMYAAIAPIRYSFAFIDALAPN